VLCAVEGGDLSFCADQWPVERRSNPKLKPETSRQYSLGTVFEPSPGWSFSADYWAIQKKDVISDIGEEVILANVQKYENTLASDGVTPIVSRDSDGFITNIVLEKRNQGEQRTSGIDFGIDWRGSKTDMGRFSARLNGTLVLESKKQTAPGEAFISNLGQFVNDGVVQRWRHRLSVDFDKGPFGATLSNTYYARYTDQNTAINLDSGNRVPPNKVKAYSLWDLAFSYEVSKATRLRAGVLNLLDTDPPFSNQAYYFLASFDPTYTDPRGRSFYASISHSFR
jgi:iron complex outermembrane recepter protein